MLDVTEWLIWFVEIVLETRQVTPERVGFFICKARHFDQHRDHLNERQNKALVRMFHEGPEGFEGSFSAVKYLSITGTSRATATYRTWLKSVH